MNYNGINCSAQTTLQSRENMMPVTLLFNVTKKVNQFLIGIFDYFYFFSIKVNWGDLLKILKIKNIKRDHLFWFYMYTKWIKISTNTRSVEDKVWYNFMYIFIYLCYSMSHMMMYLYVNIYIKLDQMANWFETLTLYDIIF